MDTATKTEGRATPWNKGKLLGQKPPLKLKEIWAWCPLLRPNDPGVDARGDVVEHWKVIEA